MDKAEFKTALTAEPPVTIKFGWFHPALILDKEGFTLKSFPNRRFLWKNVSAFHTLHRMIKIKGTGRLLLFNHETNSLVAAMNHFVYGYNTYITGVFVSREEFDSLAQLLNHWRERAISGK